MAVLTGADYRELRRSCYTRSAGKEELQALAGGTPNGTRVLDAFQEIEDDAVSHFAAQKTIIETALGVTVSNALAQKMLAAYYSWKIKQLLG